MKLLGISGTIIGAKTGILVREILETVKQAYPEVEIEYLDLMDYELEFCDGRNPGAYSEETRNVIEKVSTADFYLIGTPIFQGSIPGVLKNVFDLIHPRDFRNKVMGFVANGGTYQHYLVIESQLKPIAGFFRAFVAPSYVYANNEHFNANNEIVDPELLERISRLAEELVSMQKALKGEQANRYEENVRFIKEEIGR
jgi:FMN reductase/FAD reductase [NAD(P)H]